MIKTLLPYDFTNGLHKILTALAPIRLPWGEELAMPPEAIDAIGQLFAATGDSLIYEAYIEARLSFNGLDWIHAERHTEQPSVWVHPAVNRLYNALQECQAASQECWKGLRDAQERVGDPRQTPTPVQSELADLHRRLQQQEEAIRQVILLVEPLCSTHRRQNGQRGDELPPLAESEAKAVDSPLRSSPR